MTPDRFALTPPLALECLLCGGDAPDPRTGFCGPCDARLVAELRRLEHAEQERRAADARPPFA